MCRGKAGLNFATTERDPCLIVGQGTPPNLSFPPCDSNTLTLMLLGALA